MSRGGRGSPNSPPPDNIFFWIDPFGPVGVGGCQKELNDPELFRDHFFDTKDRIRNAKRKRKRDTISVITAPPRGALPVRQHHRCDESKILPEKRPKKIRSDHCILFVKSLKLCYVMIGSYGKIKTGWVSDNFPQRTVSISIFYFFWYLYQINKNIGVREIQQIFQNTTHWNLTFYCLSVEMPSKPLNM